MSDDKEPGITRGWKYRIKCEDGEFTGKFKGYTMIGPETALTVDSGTGTLYIPVSKVACITLLEEGETEEDKKKEDPGVYHG